jgi:hypothetical protein
LNRLLKLVDRGREMDYDWFITWANSEPRTITGNQRLRKAVQP